MCFLLLFIHIGNIKINIFACNFLLHITWSYWYRSQEIALLSQKKTKIKNSGNLFSNFFSILFQYNDDTHNILFN